MWSRPHPARTASTAAILVGALALAAGVAAAAPTPTPTPAPGPVATSSPDEIADMVMDAIQQSAASPTTPVPAPPN